MDLHHHSVLLATGVQALLTVTGTLFLLDRMLASKPADRALVVQLRKACLTNKPVEPEDAAAFAHYGFAEDDGTFDPIVREVVRAAIRGEDTDLHLVSPFVNAWDRALSDLVISREKVRVELPPEQAESLITGSIEPVGPANTPRPKPGESWLSYVLKRRPPGSEMPPPSAN